MWAFKQQHISIQIDRVAISQLKSFDEPFSDRKQPQSMAEIQNHREWNASIYGGTPQFHNLFYHISISKLEMDNWGHTTNATDWKHTHILFWISINPPVMTRTTKTEANEAPAQLQTCSWVRHPKPCFGTKTFGKNINEKHDSEARQQTQQQTVGV